MSLFKRAVFSEITSHAGIVFSTLLVVWLSVLIVRLLGEAASGDIGANVVLGLAAFSSITALPVILSVSLFVAVLTTVTRSYRESEMSVWFASGLSLAQWLRPVLQFALPVAAVVAVLTLFASPWSYGQIAEYRQRFEHRSDLSRITAGQFIETDDGNRVFFAESPKHSGDELGKVVARIIEPDWLSVVTADSAAIRMEPNGDRFLVLGPGHRYDLKPGTPEVRLLDFDRYGVRIESRTDPGSLETARLAALQEIKARPTLELLHGHDPESLSQLMWRLALPLAVLNLALIALPLGAVNPRLGRSGDLLIAGLVALLYMNLINLSRGWILNGALSFGVGVWLVHAVFLALGLVMMWRRTRVARPRRSRRPAHPRASPL
ncbi:MAG: LPS export ABC transporter permease LptF [Castellaniella sp.]|uniref:LPS export ABC transporter permease LptF n=1 Tax=Castellaniella sp. TaxID=1955812 RepID=UPI0011F805E4|nr:LPS export ABC transporter permease LptF [Castellaniella sp.]TAN30268.1 MAG: LPS export ABC transporter permease LptF [Castellaniella sp.]